MNKIENPPELFGLTVATIAIDYPQSLKILSRYGIDYSCKGHFNFTDACRALNIDPEKVWLEIQNELPVPGYGFRLKFTKWDTKVLTDYIIQNHHEYLRIVIPEIGDLLNTICSIHVVDKPELRDVRHIFGALAEDFEEHLFVEENVLFPAVVQLSKPSASKTNHTLLGNVESNINVVKAEHQRAGELMSEIRVLTENFKTPVYACPTFQMAYRMLEEFEQDLIQHMHLENNILFPRVNQDRPATKPEPLNF